ncbi:MAG: hypothetical protein VB084_12455 [Syntrophomonadaceae bacterium]|nr:hypothetical protein [Syntrophomonadaceae bacterium]
MINRQYSINEKCLDCNHLGYCQPYWGIACKRQGGNRLPRLKSVYTKQDLPDKSVYTTRDLSEKKQKTIQPDKMYKHKRSLSQPIKTKQVNWEAPS